MKADRPDAPSSFVEDVAAALRPTSGRPREYDSRVTTQIRMDPDLHEALKLAAEERGLSTNNLVCRLLRESLPRLVPVHELLITRDRP